MGWINWAWVTAITFIIFCFITGIIVPMVRSIHKKESEKTSAVPKLTDLYAELQRNAEARRLSIKALEENIMFWNKNKTEPQAVNDEINELVEQANQFYIDDEYKKAKKELKEITNGIKRNIDLENRESEMAELEREIEELEKHDEGIKSRRFRA